MKLTNEHQIKNQSNLWFLPIHQIYSEFAQIGEQKNYAAKCQNITRVWRPTTIVLWENSHKKIHSMFPRADKFC